MSFKKICFFFAFSCLMSCGETKVKNKPSAKTTPDTKTAAPVTKKPEATITQGKNGEQKITLGKIKEPTSTEVKPTVQQSKGLSSNGYYQSAQYGFKIKHPQNWDMLENQRESVPVVFMNRPKGTFSKGAESISIAAGSKDNVTLESFYNFCKTELIQSGETTGIVEESIGQNKRGQIFKRIIFNRKPNPIPSMAVSFIFVENNNSYVVTGSASTEKFNAMRALFEDVAGSIEFE